MTASPITRPAAARSDVLAAMGWMAIALLAFSAFAIAGREASREIDAIQIMLWRAPMSLPILFVIAWLTGARPHTNNLGYHVARSVFHFFAQFSWLTALALIPLAELFALEFTAPLWVAVLAPFVLGEKLTRTRLLAALLGFVGILIVVQPGSQPLTTGTIFGLLAALGFAASMMTTKLLTRTDSPFTILVYMMGLQSVFGLVAGLPGFVMPSAVTFAWLTVIAVSGLIAHFSLAQAFVRADAVLVAPMDFLRLPLIAAVGAILYGETLELVVLAGAALIIVANVLNIRSERTATAPAQR